MAVNKPEADGDADAGGAASGPPNGVVEADTGANGGPGDNGK